MFACQLLKGNQKRSFKEIYLLVKSNAISWYLFLEMKIAVTSPGNIMKSNELHAYANDRALLRLRTITYVEKKIKDVYFYPRN